MINVNQVYHKIIFGYLAFFLFGGLVLNAQEFCAFDQKHGLLLSQDQSYKSAVTDLEKLLYQQALKDMKSQKFRSSGALYTLPVVVHLIYPPGSNIGTGSNLTNLEVEHGIDLINDAFANQGMFKSPIGTDIGISFCLAKRDPSGNPSSGITRTASTLVNQIMCNPGTDAAVEGQIKSLIAWDCRQYVNIWLVTDLFNNNFGCGLAGFAYFPGAPCTVDGIMQEARYWTNAGGVGVTAHEIGHYLGLDHTFANGCANADCMLDGDRVCDTPPDNSPSFAPCGINSCNTDSPDLPDDTENYMDYTGCSPLHFTSGQKTRMVNALLLRRASLLTSNGCQPVKQLDAALPEIKFKYALCSDSICPELILRNEGISSVTTVLIDWTIDSVAQTPFVWNGNIITGQSRTLFLPCSLTTFGVHTLSFIISSLNNAPDQNSINDTLESTVEVYGVPSIQSLKTGASHCISDGIVSLDVKGGKAPYVYKLNSKNYSQTDSLFQLLSPGNYSVQVTDQLGCTTTASFAIPDSCQSTRNKKFILNKDALYQGNDCYLLTKDLNAQVGSVWYEDKIDLRVPFDIYFQINLGCLDQWGADGIAFVLQPISTSLGASGGGLGYQGIDPSIVIEFDTWENGNSNDPSYDHIAIMKNGSTQHVGPNNLAGPVPILPGAANAEDCNFHNGLVKWDPIQQTLRLYLDCQFKIEYKGDIISNTFSSDPFVFFGFTSATGGAVNVQQVCLDYVSTVSDIKDQIICKGESVQLSTSSKFPQIRWSPAYNVSNTRIYNPIFSPDSTTNYFLEISDICNFKIYDTFQIQVIDPDLNFKVSLLDSCDQNSSIYIQIFPDPQDSITLFSMDANHFSKDSEFVIPRKELITLYSKTGQCIKPFLTKITPPIPNLRDTLIWQQSRTCKDSARIFVQGMGGLPPYEYELDSSGVWLSNGDFRNLNPGSHKIRIRDRRNCEIFRSVFLGDFQNKIVLNVDSMLLQKTCCSPTAFIDVEAKGSFPLYYYSLDNDRWTAYSDFSNLKNGPHQIVARDEYGCVSDTLAFTVQDFTANNNESQSIEICNGDFYEIGQHRYIRSGSYRDTFMNQYCCDSIINTQLVVRDTYQIEYRPEICKGDFVQVGTRLYDSTGIYIDTLSSYFNCDSVVITTLLVQPVFYLNNNKEICDGDFTLVGSNKYSVSGTYIDTLPTVHLCDSVIETKLVVHPVFDQNYLPRICDGEYVEVGTKRYSATGNYIDTLRTEYSCDSVIHTMLIVNPILRTIESKKICGGDSVMTGSSIYRATGNYVDTLSTIHSCDSIVTTKLFVDTVESELRVDSIYCFDRQFGGVEIKVLEGVPSFSYFLSSEKQYTTRNKYDNLGPGKYTVYIRDSLGCIDSQQFELLVPIDLTIDLEAEVEIVLGQKATLQPILNFSPGRIQWYPEEGLSCSDCLEPEVDLLHSQTYKLLITDAHGCTEEATIYIKIDNDTKIFVPNVFSPNGDRQNDFFFAYGDNSFSEILEFHIYDRWGQQIFEREHIPLNEEEFGWDGSFRGQFLNPGVYVYYIKAERIDGSQVQISGDLTLIR